MARKTLVGEYRISIQFMGLAVPGDWMAYEEEEFLGTCAALARNKMYFEVEWR